MSATLLAAPLAEPLSLDEAKAFLRVENAEDDALVARLIVAARAHVEAHTRRVLMRSSWRVSASRWPADGRLLLPLAPVSDVLAVRIFNAGGIAQVLDPQGFVVESGSAPALVRFVPWAVPMPGRDVGGIEFDVEAGYGPAGADVPEPLRQAVRLLVAHWYENGAIVAPPGASALPAAAEALVAPFRVLSL